eukprot:238953-Chlamydomonas_euryale.AAC.1
MAATDCCRFALESDAVEGNRPVAARRARSCAEMSAGWAVAEGSVMHSMLHKTRAACRPSPLRLRPRETRAPWLHETAATSRPKPDAVDTVD